MSTLSERLWRRVEVAEDGCWLWTGAAIKGRYGTIGRGGRGAGNILTHVAAYLEKVGPIPNGWQVDHLCGLTLCCNPAHLEAVTQAENLRRQQLAITHCSHGHEFTPENTYTPPGTRKRQCRSCIKRRAPMNVAAARERRAAARATAAGADVAVWRPVDWPDRVRAELQAIA